MLVIGSRKIHADTTPVRAVVFMGVSGCGKTTVGRRFAKSIEWEFVEADSLHPSENIEKMSNGVALNDQDREPWLKSVRATIDQSLEESKNIVIACSALKERYRDILAQDLEGLRFVYLQGTFELIDSRLSNRTGHFMSRDLLQSQFETLEEPQDAIAIEVTVPPKEIVRQVRSALRL